MTYRHARRHRSFDKPWLARDHAGAPGWAIVVTAMILVAVAVLAAFPPAPPEPTYGAPNAEVRSVAVTP